ncbi:MAG: DinB family protein [Balneolaceae bacterium]
MDERQKIQQLFKFDVWCTRKMADVIIANAPFDGQETTIAYLSHIINTQKVWFSRSVDSAADRDLDFWMVYDLKDIKYKAKKAGQRWIDLVGDHDVDLDRIIHYKNSKGAEYFNALWQISNHLVIHGQHHRAQIAMILRKAGIELPNIDFINYARMDEVQKMLI